MLPMKLARLNIFDLESHSPFNIPEATMPIIRRLVLLALACLLMAGLSPHSMGFEPLAMLEEKDVTPQAVKKFLDAAFIKNTLNDDGDLVKVPGEGFTIWITVGKKTRMICYSKVWMLGSKASSETAHRLVNGINSDLVFVRLSVDDPNADKDPFESDPSEEDQPEEDKKAFITCDSFLLYDCGVTPNAIVQNYRRFAEIVEYIEDRELLAEVLAD